MTVLWSDSRAEFTPVYNGVVRALLTPDDYNQQPFRETTPPGRVYSLFYFPFERCELPRDRNHGAVCGYLCNCLTNIRGCACPRYFCVIFFFFFLGLYYFGLLVLGVFQEGGGGGPRFFFCFFFFFFFWWDYMDSSYVIWDLHEWVLDGKRFRRYSTY